MLLPALALAIQAQVNDPAREVLVLEDARFTIPEVSGGIVRVGDCSSDGTPDLFVARGKVHGTTSRIEIVSAKDGTSIRTVWTREKNERDPVWDAGGDADGDGCPDLVLGNRRAHANAGEVLVVSGRTSTVIHRVQGARAGQALGATVRWIGDVNGDGADDFAAASPACDLDYVEFLLTQGESRNRNPRDVMKERCSATGDVTAFSGKDAGVLWKATGTSPGTAFGSVMSPADDFDHDGSRELIVQPSLRAGLPASVISSTSGRLLFTLGTTYGPIVDAGDIDADGVGDFVIMRMDERLARFASSSLVISGKTRTQLFSIRHPDEFSKFARIVSLGDLDGDGHAEIGIGDTYFCVHEDSPRPSAPDLRKARLAEMIAVESMPRGGNPFESGCAIVYSGKTHQPMFGVWAEYGSQTGLGFELVRLGDINADGRDDILVTGHDAAYAFAVPPRAH